ncbi:MAG: multicopper oxidase domain-containing protein [Candidatus Obscuribacterales bacterium]|nr:multicopper oxidase domain-containing protein [Candidatus Obscuribacterales bacterium]
MIIRLLTLLLLSVFFCPALFAQIDDAADLRTQQEQERNELGDMKKQIDDIKSNMENALKDMSRVQSMVRGEGVKEFHLQVKESNWEAFPGCVLNQLTYNNQSPGPCIRVNEGDQVKLFLHNGLKTPTSLYIQGMRLPHKVDGLPRKGAGLIAPGEVFVYQFIASQPGTFYYRPHVPHLDQMQKGLVGAIVVEPKSIPKTYERDQLIILSQANAAEQARKASASGQKTALSSNLFLLNGKSAQAIPALDLKNGERIRLRVINVAPEACTFSLTGHRLEIVAQNGSEGVEPHTVRDTVTIHPGERMDLEFSADNPGVWSLSALNASQCSFNGQFPGGFAMVVRYPDALKEAN